MMRYVTMTLKLIPLVLTLALLSGVAFSQETKLPAETRQKMETVRLHIDGFSKSKSGAV